MPILFIICCKKTNNTSPSPPVQVDNKLPKVQTNAIANLTYYSVQLSGQLLDSAGAKISETGIVIDTDPTPTTSKNLDKFVLKKLQDAPNSFTHSPLAKGKPVEYLQWLQGSSYNQADG